MRLGRARLVASAAVITTLVGGLAAVTLPSAGAATAPAVLSASAATPVPAGAARLGVLPGQRKLTVDVALNLRDEAGLDALVNGVANPKSPYYRQFAGPGQLGPLFGLPLARIAQVTGALRSLGLDPGPVDAARLFIPVTATAAALDRAFGVGLTDYRLPGGRVAYANSSAPRVPSAVAPYIEGVLGLDNVYLPQHLDGQSAAVAGPAPATPAVTRPAAAGPAPCSAATDAAVGFRGFTADQLAAHYLMTTLYKMGDLGQGTRVAVAELEPDLTSDINAYKACYGIKTPVSYVSVNPGVGTGAGSGEAALDIENIAGLVPDAAIDVYQAPNTTSTELLDIATRVLDNDRDRTLSISWGLCESEAGSSLLSHYQTVFKELNAEGITVVAAAGDNGPTGCYNAAAKSPSRVLSVVSPASANYVIAVGGTSFQSATALSPETAWNASGTTAAGAGGGGVSALCMPSYQDLHQTAPTVYPLITGLISSHSKKSKPCAHPGGNPNGYLRQLPDLSAAASATDSYVIYHNGAWAGFYGTSGAATTVAAEAALTDASAYCSPRGWNSGAAGLLPQALYAIIAFNDSHVYLDSTPQAVLDITKGNTDYTGTGYKGGLYPATRGYDLASGLGAPLLTGTRPQNATFIPGLSAFMCARFIDPRIGLISTRSVSPAYAKAGRAVTVTVHGTGMVAVPYTDGAEINTNGNTRFVVEPWAFCSSHTTCRVTIPALKAGTYQVELKAVNFLPCLTCKAYVTFRVANAPHISSLSTSKGHRGTKITIHGANFIGVKAVYFGGRKGTSVKVSSAGKLTVVAPAGSGQVAVTVVAVGGTSNTRTFTY